jgi:hypothetical protein
MVSDTFPVHQAVVQITVPAKLDKDVNPNSPLTKEALDAAMPRTGWSPFRPHEQRASPKLEYARRMV